MAVQVQKVDPLLEMARRYVRKNGAPVLAGEPVHIPDGCRVDEFGGQLTRPAAKKRFNRLVHLILGGKLQAA
jgi:hypothetical protein